MATISIMDSSEIADKIFFVGVNENSSLYPLKEKNEFLRNFLHKSLMVYEKNTTFVWIFGAYTLRYE